jgi:hypothetical protein
MPWYRLVVRNGDVPVAGKGRAAFIDALTLLVVAAQPPGPLPSTPPRIYTRGDDTSWEVLIPPTVSTVARSYIESLGGERLEEPPDTSSYQARELAPPR